MARAPTWTDELVEKAKELWNSGLSTAQVANELGSGHSRNAVIGKLHRLGLTGQRKPPVASPKPRRASTAKFKPRVVAREGGLVADPVVEIDPEKISEFDTAIPVGQRLQLEQLTEDTCKWPVGDPQQPGTFFFCGGRALQGRPYCGTHFRVAYTPAGQRQNQYTAEERAAFIARGKRAAAVRRASQS